MKQLCKRKRVGALLILALLLAGFGSMHRAYASTITVTTFADTPTVGNCSLRQAIQAANTDVAVGACPAGSGADTIQLSAGTYTLSLPNSGGDENNNQSGDLDILNSLTIKGVDVNTTHITTTVALDRVMQIPTGSTVTLIGLSISNGHSGQNGGAIDNSGTLTLDEVVIKANFADGNGGGIYNDGVLMIFGGIVGNNAASGNGGGIDNNGGTLTTKGAILNNNVAGGSGGAISNNATLVIDHIWMHDNTASGNSGGDIYNSGAASIINSFIHNGIAAQNGGNIYSGDGSGLSSLTISSTTLLRGLAGANGGGVFNDGALNLTNVTIAENRAASGSGIYNVENIQSLNLTNTTIVSNSNSSGSSGSGIFNAGTALTPKNTLIAHNGTLGNCAGSGSISSAGHNLTSDGTCSFTAAGDLINTNPLLGLLQDNGGVTFAYGGAAPTYALLPGSPAINAGTNVGCPATDQRNIPRPRGPNCDIGAYETNNTPATLNDTYTTDEDIVLVVGQPGVLGNDTDPDNDVITASLVIQPVHGVLTLNANGSFSYAPDANYHGPDSFSYRVSDGAVSSPSTAVSLTVNSVNDLPIAANDTASTAANTALIIPVAMLLSNDSDPEGDPLTISDVRGNSARGGRVMLSGSNVVYTPPTNFNGVDSLIYTLSDGNGGATSGTVTVTVGMRQLYLPAARR
jgi:CSLREA domain-containing protein